MDADLILVVSMVVAAMSIPAMASAYSEARRPVAAFGTLIIAGVMAIYATRIKPGGYTLAEIPEVFFSVLARFIP
ncbi:hypothetical protein KQ247_07105 [Ruegeria pomeroyi]|jgi:hypothetical protein|uniref:50S ribosomal protein L35 n=1 Tax=Ruegeria pomeroyi TaxID=89184 RepID=A0A850LF20_9RHOB|nr:hypothetical protein [Ruegeria pomeroyi]NVK96369.1 hypothetical protein [Ruegeria pomeroyi]NVL01715.1 hypothetical protein [Ruegeria pomeroyi]QWV10355.1 hypothetical protein KQ247_07105 [Ruegeria pomeroyi]HCE70230.1 hypothetical protein [Ruegeria sp.]